jgi:hypothetical protein
MNIKTKNLQICVSQVIDFKGGDFGCFGEANPKWLSQ